MYTFIVTVIIFRGNYKKNVGSITINRPHHEQACHCRLSCVGQKFDYVPEALHFNSISFKKKYKGGLTKYSKIGFVVY